MKLEWLPDSGPLKGAFVFLSASVPDPDRNPRFLDGPLERAIMLRIIDRRVDDAVRSLLAHTFSVGGRIVHGGHPKIIAPITYQASFWDVPTGVEPPVRIYQSKYFEKYPEPPGRGQLVRAGVGTVRWVSANLGQIAARWEHPA